jgi:membrane associated rhomboid family serine protease
VNGLELSAQPLVFAMRPGRGTIALHATGFRHPRSPRSSADGFSSYADVTHLALGRRALRIGTRRGLVRVARNSFASPDGAEALVRALIERIAREPGGALQMARMAEIEETARQAARPVATRVLVLACLAGFLLQAWLGPGVHHAGFFSSQLASSGEPWRLVTANLLHAGLGHFVMNALGLIVLGGLLERTVGSLRTTLVAGLAALGATLAGMLASYDAMVGASGIVAGFAGALLWLELRMPERLPAQWRIPRRPFIAALLLDAMLPLMFPVIAGVSHLGGFAAGALAASLVTGPGLRREPLRPAATVAVALVLALAGASIASAARLFLGGAAWEGHAKRLLELDTPPILILNDAAWLIATEETPTQKALAEARELAQRAVSETGRQDPNLLDTLAEVQFQSGDDEAAVETIEEAIALVPGVPYFEEQRRRFTGERDRNDRPAPPEGSSFGPERRPEPEAIPKHGFDQDPGISI